jgi:DNA-nicking Smr family endonuclease
MSGKSGKGKGEGERFSDLVDDVVPIEDRDQTHPAESPRPKPAGREATTSPSSKRRFFRDLGEGSGRAEDAPKRLVAELRLGEYPPDREIDLHGLRREPARRALTQGLETALTARERCVLVIHGIGKRSPDGPVLKQAVPDWIERSPQSGRVAAYAPAPLNLGGEGATLILLRQPRRSTSERR